MASLRKPYIYVIVAIIAIVLIIHFSGILSPKPSGLTIDASLESSSIKMGENTTLTVIIENKAAFPKKFEFRIVYTSKNLTYYHGMTKAPLPGPVEKDENYTITYTEGLLDPNGRIELPVIVEGFLPIEASSKRFTISLEVYSADGASKVLSDSKSVSLTVTRT